MRRINEEVVYVILQLMKLYNLTKCDQETFCGLFLFFFKNMIVNNK